jgi:hypothetical protein
MATNQTDDLLLLHLNEAIATLRDKDQLFQIIARKLRLIFAFDMMGISIFDEKLLNKRLFFKDYTTINPPEPAPANSTVFTPIAGSPVELLLKDPRIQHIELREHLRQYPTFEAFQRLLRLGIQYMTMVPMWLNGRLTGFLILATVRPPVYSAADEQLLEKITSLVAVAVRNTLDFEEVARREQQRSLQLNVTNALLSIKQREPLFRAIAEELQQVVPFDYFGIRVQRAGERGTFEGFAEFARPDDNRTGPLPEGPAAGNNCYVPAGWRPAASGGHVHRRRFQAARRALSRHAQCLRRVPSAGHAHCTHLAAGRWCGHATAGLAQPQRLYLRQPGHRAKPGAANHAGARKPICLRAD